MTFFYSFLQPSPQPLLSQHHQLHLDGTYDVYIVKKNNFRRKKIALFFLKIFNFHAFTRRTLQLAPEPLLPEHRQLCLDSLPQPLVGLREVSDGALLQELLRPYHVPGKVGGQAVLLG